MASVRGLAVGSGVTFALGSVAGALGNNLAEGRVFWVGFVASTALGALVSGWLTYRAAESGVAAASIGHRGNNEVRSVKSKSGPAAGVNYGTMHGGQRDSGGTP